MGVGRCPHCRTFCWSDEPFHVRMPFLTTTNDVYVGARTFNLSIESPTRNLYTTAGSINRRIKADSYSRVTSPASEGVKRNAFAAVERVRKKSRLRPMQRRSMKAFASHGCRRNATASTRCGSMNQPLSRLFGVSYNQQATKM